MSQSLNDRRGMGMEMVSFSCISISRRILDQKKSAESLISTTGGQAASVSRTRSTRWYSAAHCGQCRTCRWVNHRDNPFSSPSASALIFSVL